MNKYNVKSGKGTLIPDWIVEKMLDEQVKQGNPRNVKVFEDNLFANEMFGGFTWTCTENYKQNNHYWIDIITNGIYPPKPSTDVDELVEKVSNVIRDNLTNSFVLPEISKIIDIYKWCIKVGDPSKYNVFNTWRKTSDAKSSYHGSDGYLAYDGIFYSRLPKNHTLITFEQFQKYVLGVEFILPELWGVKLTEQNIDTVTGWRGTTKNPSGGNLTGNRYYGSYILNKEPKGKFTAYCVSNLPEGYTEITYEQFLQYVLKPSSPNFVKQHLVEKSPKYKVGDWVVPLIESGKGKSGSHCRTVGIAYQIYEIDISKVFTYNSLSKNDGNGKIKFDEVRKATSEEIKDALLAEAESKYPIGTRFKSAYSGFICEVTDKIRIAVDNDGLVSEGNYILYKDKWAEIIKTPDIIINGYKAEFFPTYVKFGCAEINKKVFIELATINKYANTNRDVESVTIGKGVFTKAQIKEIANYYNELQ